jgi:hypothetical protein
VIDQAAAELELTGSTCPTWVLPDADAHAYARLALTEPQVTALRDKAWPMLSVRERRGVFEATRERAVDGQLPVGLLMSLVPKLLTTDRFEIGDTVGDYFTAGFASGMPLELRDKVPAALVPAAKARMRGWLAPLAKRLGLAAKPHDTLDDELARLDVLGAEAWIGDPALSRAAVALAAHYRDLPSGSRGSVLAIAIDASPALATKLLADAFAEADPELRATLFGALGAIHDPARLRAMLDTALAPNIGARDIPALLGGYTDAATRAVVDSWIRAHLADIQRAIPTTGSETFPPILFLVRAITGACDASRRDEIVAYVTRTFGAMPSGERPTREAIDDMDQCIAQRKLVEPSLRSWLSAKAP